VALILDSSGLLAAVDTDQRSHQVAREALEHAAAPLLISPFVLAELDYILMTRVGTQAESARLALRAYETTISSQNKGSC
jgi:predicted nucleic acid-binding protein